MVVDMLWNVLAISSRVAALALFALHQLHWFWSLLGAQIFIATSASLVYERFSESKEDFIIDMSHFSYARKTEGENGISHLISKMA